MKSKVVVPPVSGEPKWEVDLSNLDLSGRYWRVHGLAIHQPDCNCGKCVLPKVARNPEDGSGIKEPSTETAPERPMELLLCPFCGSGKASLLLPTCRPETPYNPADRLYPVVRCSECYADIPGDNEDYKGGSAITKWNTRVAPSVPNATANHAQPLIPPKSDVGSGKPKEHQDSKRLDWLQSHRHAQLTNTSPVWRGECDIMTNPMDGTGPVFHHDKDIRKAIDAAMQKEPQ